MALSYEASGVRYDQLDAFKRACQRAARATTDLLGAHGYQEPATIRGDSAYLIEAADHYLAHVEEGLGTKNLVADAVQLQTGRSFYREIGIDTVATIVNDLITCGALPITVAMHAAVGDSNWFADERRAADLVAGFAEGCRTAGIGCIQCKGWAADSLVQVLEPIRLRRASITETHVKEILEDGSTRARARAEQTMQEVRAAMQISVGL